VSRCGRAVFRAAEIICKPLRRHRTLPRGGVRPRQLPGGDEEEADGREGKERTGSETTVIDIKPPVKTGGFFLQKYLLLVIFFAGDRKVLSNEEEKGLKRESGRRGVDDAGM